MRLDSIMVMQRGAKEIRNLFSGILLISFVVTSLIVSIMLILNQLGWVDFHLPVSILLLTGLGGLLTAWNLVQNNLFTKYRLFNQISTAFVIASIFSVIFQAIFHLLGFEERGLIYGWLVGLIASFIYNLRVAKGRISKDERRVGKSVDLDGGRNNRNKMRSLFGMVGRSEKHRAYV